MNVFEARIILYTLVVSKYLYVIQKDEREWWVELCRNDYKNCPNCFDERSKFDAESFLDNVGIETSVELEASILFGNRKIQHGTYDRQKVVLKYLIGDESLNHLKRKCCNGKADCEKFWNTESHVEVLKTEMLRVFQTKESESGFQICPKNSVTRFMEIFSQQSVYAWLLLNLNVEPLIVDTLGKRNFSVPKLHDSCGFVTLQTNNGLPLYLFYDQSFAVRVLIAKNLLSSALDFSYGLEGFRIYLTDATPDNIVVDDSTFDVTFVDLDNVFLVDSKTLANNRIIHRHEKIACDGMCFAYVPEELCSYHLSDINLFAICQLFVEDYNRMPDKGLLHSAPDTITDGYPELQQLIDQCIDGSVDGDRFMTVNLLLELFNKILFS